MARCMPRESSHATLGEGETTDMVRRPAVASAGGRREAQWQPCPVTLHGRHTPRQCARPRGHLRNCAPPPVTPCPSMSTGYDRRPTLEQDADVGNRGGHGRSLSL